MWQVVGALGSADAKVEVECRLLHSCLHLDVYYNVVEEADSDDAVVPMAYFVLDTSSVDHH